MKRKRKHTHTKKKKKKLNNGVAKVSLLNKYSKWTEIVNQWTRKIPSCEKENEGEITRNKQSWFHITKKSLKKDDISPQVEWQKLWKDIKFEKEIGEIIKNWNSCSNLKGKR